MQKTGKIQGDGIHCYEELDGRVQRLVAVINNLPGLRTVTSCGGHQRADNHQVGKGEFRVRVQPTGASALRSLAIIQQARVRVSQESIEVKMLAAEPEYIYEVSGTDNVDPDALASAMETVQGGGMC
jgi:hypothetical protein